MKTSGTKLRPACNDETVRQRDRLLFSQGPDTEDVCWAAEHSLIHPPLYGRVCGLDSMMLGKPRAGISLILFSYGANIEVQPSYCNYCIAIPCLDKM